MTYIGGATGIQYPTGVGVDSGFNVYVAGTTNSATYPTTSSAFQTAPASAGNHVFVSKIDSNGSLNDYSTYLSGNGVDTASDMTLDSQGRVYVIGTTTSSNFPTTIGALQATAGAANQFFFSKLIPTLNGASSLVYSTYIGGTHSRQWRCSRWRCRGGCQLQCLSGRWNELHRHGNSSAVDRERISHPGRRVVSMSGQPNSTRHLPTPSSTRWITGLILAVAAMMLHTASPQTVPTLTSPALPPRPTSLCRIPR